MREVQQCKVLVGKINLANSWRRFSVWICLLVLSCGGERKTVTVFTESLGYGIAREYIHSGWSDDVNILAINKKNQKTIVLAKYDLHHTDGDLFKINVEGKTIVVYYKNGNLPLKQFDVKTPEGVNFNFVLLSTKEWLALPFEAK